jgi:hypothetical protein
METRMSDLTSHTRDDLVELPCDTEPPSVMQPSPAFRHADGCLSTVSAPLCECKRPSLTARLHASVAMLDGASNVVDIAHARSARAGRR